MIFFLLALDYGSTGTFSILEGEGNNVIMINRGLEDGIQGSHLEVFDENGFIMRLLCFASQKSQSACKAYHTVRWHVVKVKKEYNFRSIQHKRILPGAILEPAFRF